MAHVYDKDGKPHFHLTPAQAKKEGLFFSVTEHQKVLAKPALERWLIGEHLKAAFKYPPVKGRMLKALLNASVLILGKMEEVLRSLEHKSTMPWSQS